MGNAALGWALVLAGMISGGAMGLRFQDDGWLGGHGAWRRRLLRLAHVAAIALGVLNVIFVLQLPQLRLSPVAVSVAAWCLAAGALLMPACCLLAAWKRPARHLFPVPVTCLVAGVSLVAVGLLRGA